MRIKSTAQLKFLLCGTLIKHNPYSKNVNHDISVKSFVTQTYRQKAAEKLGIMVNKLSKIG
jgi:hypothetical protein